MPPIVYLKKCEDYELSKLTAVIQEGFKELGGIEKFIVKGDTVLLKPNCLAAAAPETAITTHPEFLRAVIRVIKPLAGRIIVGDSPGYGSFIGACAKNGMKKVCDEEGAEIIEFKPDTRADVKNQLLYGNFMIDSRVMKADKIINLPKLKTHMLMYMSMCVKNTFGLISGIKKVEYHAKAEKDKFLFAKMLVDLHRAKLPVLNILDGILAMEGNGPGADGKPFNMGLVAMSADGFALDTAVAKTAGVDPYKIYTNYVYKESVNNGKDIEFEIKGNQINEVFHKIKAPPGEPKGSAFRGLINFIREHGTPKPVFRVKLCTGCKICVTHCPVNALKYESKEKGVICDYHKCIRCYCCHEMCPEKAIKITRPLISMLIDKFS
ncbi:MAG: DUF362 domain-containing protein [Candidatus Goldbacteria bacterium]|nr:DUF362 domain-containing protein [Candidatus Goldiibacteriota bacterium]